MTTPRTEQTPLGLATYSTADFRTYPPFPYVDGNGDRMVLQECESLIAGRWEPFVSIVGREQTYARLIGERSA